MPEVVKHVSYSAGVRRSGRAIPKITLTNCARSVLQTWQVPMRSLPLWHVYWNLTTGARLILAGKDIPMKPDFIYLIPGNLRFAAASDGGFEQFFCDFLLEDEKFARIRREPVIFPVGPYEALLKKFRNKKFSALTVNALILFLLDEIPETAFEKQGKTPLDPRIQAALEIVAAAILKSPIPKLDNGELAREIGMSVTNFQHLFKREMKISPYRYIMNKRLELAYELLKINKSSIKRVAEVTGFANRYRFTTAFTALYGYPPGVCRKKMQSAEA